MNHTEHGSLQKFPHSDSNRMSKLSILITTLQDRYDYLKRLQDILMPQVLQHSDRVEVCIHDAGRAMTTGEKRNQLIENCDGDYFVFIDDDDLVACHYVESILNAMDEDPDVITFRGYMLTDGLNKVDFIIRLGENYEERGGKYYRFPNHITVMKKELVERFKFQHIWMGEDYLWAKEIHDSGVLKKEVHIPRNMYQYLFRTNK